MKVLIVDDDRTNILVLKGILEKYEYSILSASNGLEAVDMFVEHRPDIVLMDLMMPVMDGYEATRRIKELAGQDFVPVIFLTAITDEKALAKCIESGGDDFLTKPYNHIVLKAKVDAMARIRELNETIVTQNRELSYHHSRVIKEQAIAEKIFSNIVTAGYTPRAGVRHHMSSMALFNGDLVLFASRPTGGLHVLVGDFTGHGLSAAVGALPVSDIFYAMTSGGFSVGDIVEEINKKLYKILPTDMFFAACMLELDNIQKTITIWGGGMPELLVLNSKGEIYERITHRYLPLGILSPERFSRGCDIYSVEHGDKVILLSDGVTEMCNGEGKMLGKEGLENIINNHNAAEDSLFDTVIAGLDEYSDGLDQADDITLMELTCLEERYSEGSLEGRKPNKPPMEWELKLKLDRAVLQKFDPLPYLNKSIMEMQGLYSDKEKIYTILAELISNAVDHGILGLDSAMRATPEGFAQYFMERERRLADDGAEAGWVEVTIQHKKDGSQGLMNIHVSDSGKGFDVKSLTGKMADVDSKSGRGIPLINALCESVRYSDSGSSVEAAFRWGEGGEQKQLKRGNA